MLTLLNVLDENLATFSVLHCDSTLAFAYEVECHFVIEQMSEQLLAIALLDDVGVGHFVENVEAFNDTRQKVVLALLDELDALLHAQTETSLARDVFCG